MKNFWSAFKYKINAAVGGGRANANAAVQQQDQEQPVPREQELDKGEVNKIGGGNKLG